MQLAVPLGGCGCSMNTPGNIAPITYTSTTLDSCLTATKDVAHFFLLLLGNMLDNSQCLYRAARLIVLHDIYKIIFTIRKNKNIKYLYMIGEH